MQALARHQSPSPGPQAPALRAVDVPDRAGRMRLSAWDVALYAVGLTAGFLLAAAASGAGGTAIVTGQLVLAGVSALVAGVAGLRHRALVRRAARPPRR